MSLKSTSTPRILLLDIETAPANALVWALHNQYVGPEQLVSHGYVLCVSWKWLGEKKLYYERVAGREKAALSRIHKALDQADFVIHYNGTKFDIPTLNREFVLCGMAPPSPVKQLDLLKTVRKQFKFSSNKLDYVCQRLGLGNKVHHKGLRLWKDVMDGVESSWAVMSKYNKWDVVLLERLYHRILPWINNHPNTTLYTGKLNSCPRCSSVHYQSRGVYKGATISYQRLQCNNCKGWFKGAVHPSHAKLEHTTCT